METIRSNGRSLQYAALIIYSSAVPKHWPCEKNRNSAAIQVNHFDFVASAPAYFSEAGWMWRNRAFYGVECGRNCARRPSDSRPLRGTPPRLLLFPHHGATPSADVVEHLFVEQHQEKTLSHWHGALAGRAEQLARLQAFEILLLLWSHLSCLSVPSFCRSLGAAATAETPGPRSWGTRRRARGRDYRDLLARSI